MNKRLLRKVSSTERISEIIDPQFDGLALAAGDAFNRRPAGVPHCDCEQANKKFFGRIKNKYELEMVPTKASGGHCVYCGHVAPLMPPPSLAASARGFLRTPGTRGFIIGVEVATGKQERFESVSEAVRAGHRGHLYNSIEKGTTTHGWQWKRIND